jgi:flagellar hook-associated protein 3 FlgL
MKVQRASEDPAAWATGARAEMRNTMSEGRGRGVAAARERLDETDNALGQIGGALEDVVELATQMANGTMTAAERSIGAIEVRALRDHMLAMGNSRGASGEFLLGGAVTDTQPFTGTGTYGGDGSVRQIPSSEGGTLAGSVPGTVLDGSTGVDVFAALDALATALDSNDQVAVQASLDTFRSAVGQVAKARSTVGARMKALEGADTAREAFEGHLAEQQTRAVGADPAEAISALTAAANGLEVARSLAEQLATFSKMR